MAIQLRGGNQLLDAVKILEQGGIKDGYTVADLGCGTSGHFVFPAAHLVGPKGKVYAVDILKSVLQAIDSRTRLEGVDNVEAVWSDLERAGGLKITPGSVDLTLLLNILALVKDKETGMIAEENNAKDLAAKINYLLENDERRIRIGEQGSAWLKECCNYSRNLDAYKAAINRALRII